MTIKLILKDGTQKEFKRVYCFEDTVDEIRITNLDNKVLISYISQKLISEVFVYLEDDEIQKIGDPNG